MFTVDHVILLVLFVIQVSKYMLVANIIVYAENITSNCRHGDIRLVGGDSNREGIVEICINNLWGGVCVNGWDTRAANVSCRHAGFLDTDCKLSIYDILKLLLHSPFRCSS